jgi:hypothetical protein
VPRLVALSSEVRSLALHVYKRGGKNWYKPNDKTMADTKKSVWCVITGVQQSRMYYKRANQKKEPY